MLKYKQKLLIKKLLMVVRHPILTVLNVSSRYYISNHCKISGGGGKFHIGDEVQFGSNLKVKFLSNHGELSIGKRCYFGDYISIYCTDKITIEADNLFASHIFITTENHSFDPENPHSYGHQPLTNAPVYFKQGSWIGENVTFISSKEGLEIGQRCVIAAGSVVTKSIPDYCMAAGGPAKVIKKYNFETHTWNRVI